MDPIQILAIILIFVGPSITHSVIVLAPFAHCFITPFPLLLIIVPLSSFLSALHLSFSLQTINNGTHTSLNPKISSRSAFSFVLSFSSLYVLCYFLYVYMKLILDMDMMQTDIERRF